MASAKRCKDCLAEGEWRPVPGYEDRYEVTADGRVRSVDVVTTDKNGRVRLLRGRELKHKIDSFGYHLIELRNGLGRKVPGGRKNRSVHRMVAECFIGPSPFDGAVVMHLDDDPSNNHVDNLRWGTQTENVQACVAAGRFRSRHEEKTGCPQGHPYDMFDSRGQRSCRECRRIAQRKYRERRAEVA